MQTAPVLAATLIHAAVLVGMGLLVEPWLQRRPIDAHVAVVLAEEVLEVPEEVEPEEDVLPEPTAEEVFAEVEEDVEPAECEVVEAPVPADEVDPRFAVPRRLQPLRELLHRLPRKREEAPAPQVAAAPPLPPRAEVDAEALDAGNEPPGYPRIARRQEVEAEVVLLVTVDASGAVRDVVVLESAGSSAAQRALDRSAVDAVRRWRYRPAMRDGRPVEARIKVPIHFRLR